MRSLMRGGGVCLLHWQVAVVSRSVQALGIGATACEVFLENNCEKKGGKSVNIESNFQLSAPC